MLNKVMLIGNLGKNPELVFTQAGQAKCSFSVATSETFTDGSGQRQKRTEWHNIVVWAKQAENCKKFLSKGSTVYVEGKIQTRSWDDSKTGQKRYTTEIIAQTVQFLSGKVGSGQQEDPGHGHEPTEAPRPPSGPVPSDDDLPF